MPSETSRIEELQRYQILDTPPDGTFNDVCAIVSRFFNTPVAIVTLVDTDRVWFGAAHGLGNLREIGRGPGLCASAILQDDVYVAPDLRKDPNSFANPLVAKQNGFRFYAAAPLKSARNFNLGTMCVLDFAPRPFSDDDQHMLERFSRIVMQLMEHRLASRAIAGLATEIERHRMRLAHLASHDSLTNLLNRAAMERHLDEVWSTAKEKKTIAFILLDVDHFKSVNDTHGHPVGDIVLQQVAQRLQEATRAQDRVARVGGEEFAISIRDVTLEQALATAERIRQSVRATPVAFDGGSLTVTLSGGVCMARADTAVDTLMRAADTALYHAKRSGRNRIAFCQVTRTGADTTVSPPELAPPDAASDGD